MLRFLATVLDNATVLHDELVSLRQQSQASANEDNIENGCAEETTDDRRGRNSASAPATSVNEVHRGFTDEGSSANLGESGMDDTSDRRISEVVAIRPASNDTSALPAPDAQKNIRKHKSANHTKQTCVR